MAIQTTAIDRASLDAIRALQAPGGDDLVAKIVRTFMEESARLSRNIEQAVAASDIEGVRANAHSLKSCSGNVGANQLAVLARDMETAARRGTLDDADGALSELQAELRRAVAELEGMFGAA